MKIHIPDGETRNHDDRAGKYHNNILGGAVNEDEDQSPGDEEEQENDDGDLDAWTTAQEEESEALASLATANRTLRVARETQRQVRMSRGYFPQQQVQRDRTNRRQERKCVICSGPRWASQCPGKQGNQARSREKRQPFQRTANCPWRAHRNEHVRKRSAANRKGVDWLWCNQIYVIVGGTGRVGTHERTTTGFNSFFLGSRKEDVVHFCNWEKTTERRRGRIQGECWWSDGGQQDQLFEYNRSAPFCCLYRVCHRWEPLFTSAQVQPPFISLTDQSFVQLERNTNGHLFLSLVEDMLSQPILDKGQLQGFQAAAQLLENRDK